MEQEHYVALKSNSIKIEVENYYAVDYIDRFYIGRILQGEKPQFWNMNFLHHSTPTREKQFSSGLNDQTSTRFIKTTFFGDQSISKVVCNSKLLVWVRSKPNFQRIFLNYEN